MIKEIWKYIPDFNNRYQTSNLGRLRSVGYYDTIGRWVRGKLLPGSKVPDGYLSVYLRKNGKAFGFRIHRLVAVTFIPNPENKPFINHKNCNKTDNRVSNLEWCTNVENIEHAKKNNLLLVGENTSNAKLTNKQVLLIYNSSLSNKELSIKYGVLPSNISAIKIGQRWSWLTGHIYKRKRKH